MTALLAFMFGAIFGYSAPAFLRRHRARFLADETDSAGA